MRPSRLGRGGSEALLTALGCRNHEAKKIMKEKMRLGQRCLFYASNCKVPGITAVAKVSSEGYPDHNAWDPKHPSVFRSTFMGGF